MVSVRCAAIWCQSAVQLIDTIQVLDTVLQVSTLEPFIYDVFINDIWISIRHSIYCLFVDIEIVCTVSCATDCTLLKSDIDCIPGWCVTNNIIGSNDKIIYYIYRKN